MITAILIGILGLAAASYLIFCEVGEVWRKLNEQVVPMLFKALERMKTLMGLIDDLKAADDKLAADVQALAQRVADATSILQTQLAQLQQLIADGAGITKTDVQGAIDTTNTIDAAVRGILPTA